MEQLTLEHALARGEEAMQACADKAEAQGFSTDAARAFILNWLAEYGPTVGEDIVDAAKATGHADLSPHKGQAWGSVFTTLRKSGRIHCVEICLRRKGHGTAGSRRWALVQ